jgi:hypothetical protein
MLIGLKSDVVEGDRSSPADARAARVRAEAAFRCTFVSLPIPDIEPFTTMPEPMSVDWV